MATAKEVIPPLPPGFTLDDDIPPLPDGFTLDPPDHSLALAKQVISEYAPGDRPKTLKSLLAFGEEPQRETFLKHYGQTVKEMAIPAAMAGVGSLGGIYGTMAGAGLGELANQALGVYGKSVMPGADIDTGKLWLSAAAPAVIHGAVKGAQGIGKAGKWVGDKVSDAIKRTVEPLSKSGQANILARSRAEMAGNSVNILRDVAAATKGASAYVPGSNPTAGQAMSDIPGATGLIAHEMALAKHKGLSPAYQMRMAEQEAARSGAIESIAKTPDALEKALALRETVTKPIYDTADKMVVSGDDVLSELLSRPSMAKAMKRAIELAKDKGEVIQFGKNLPQRTEVSSLVSSSGRPITTERPAEYAQYPTRTLKYLKMALDDMTKNPERFSIGAAEVSAINGVRGSLNEWLGKKNPVYDMARDIYRGMSSKPNRMMVGQYLEQKLNSPLETAGGVSIPKGERAALFAQAVNDAPRTLNKALGRDLFDSLDQVMKPEEVRAVNNIVKDLARNEAMRKLGSQTSMNMSDAIPGDVGAHIPNLLYRPTMIANAILRSMGRNAEDEIGKVAMDQALSPRLYSSAIEKGIPYAEEAMKRAAPHIPSRYELMMQAILNRQAPFTAATATQLQPDF